MTAEDALKQYGSPFSSIRRVGDKIELRNSTGKTIQVRPGTRVYHRGHMRFALYSELRDARYGRARKMRKGQEHGQALPKGKHRNQGDTRHSKTGGYV